MCLLGRLKILFIVSIIFSVVALNGLDNVQAGLRQAWTGKSAQTLTSSAVESATGIYIAGEIVDAGIGMISPGGVLKFAQWFKKTCFTAGTQIVVGEIYNEEFATTIYATVNIEDIKVGDLVYSYDTITGEVSQNEVTDTFVRTSDHINYLTIIDENGNEQIIETTDSHPFWVVTNDPDLDRAAKEIVSENDVTLYHENIGVTENGYWVEAKDIREGDVFLGANGELSILVSTERVEFPEGITVYNFAVDGNHDYFVIAQTDELGQTCILVHNTKYQTPTPAGWNLSNHAQESLERHGFYASNEVDDIIANATRIINNTDGATAYIQKVSKLYNAAIANIETKTIITAVQKFTWDNLTAMLRKNGFFEI